MNFTQSQGIVAVSIFVVLSLNVVRAATGPDSFVVPSTSVTGSPTQNKIPAQVINDAPPGSSTQNTQDDPVAKKRKECKKVESQREATCLKRGKTSWNEDTIGGFVCEEGRLSPAYKLSTQTSAGLSSTVSCAAERTLAVKTKNKTCSNVNNSQSVDDKNTCKNGVTRIPSKDLGVSAADAKKAGIKCFFEEKEFVTVCNDDQEDLKKLTKNSKGKDIASAPSSGGENAFKKTDSSSGSPIKASCYGTQKCGDSSAWKDSRTDTRSKSFNPYTDKVIAVGDGSPYKYGDKVEVCLNGTCATATVRDHCPKCGTSKIDLTQGVADAIGFDFVKGINRITVRRAVFDQSAEIIK